MKAARGERIGELAAFIRGRGRDGDALVAGLTPPHSSGAVEGHVNRTNVLKRQMFGRADTEVLCKRLLVAA